MVISSTPVGEGEDVSWMHRLSGNLPYGEAAEPPN